MVKQMKNLELHYPMIQFLIISNSPLYKRDSTGASFSYCLDWKSKHFNWNFYKWKATQPSSRVFSGKLFKWDPCKSYKIPFKTLMILWPVYPIHTNSLFLGDIWRATILPFSSSKFFFSLLRPSNLVDLLFGYFSFSSKRGERTILFPSPLAFL